MAEVKLTNFIEGIVEKEDWTFATADTRYMTHGFHPYPARMIPQVARKLIDMFTTSEEDVALDPYCGSGTVLVEARLKGINSIGVDANPLAVLMAKVKTTPINPELLTETYRILLTRVHADIQKNVIFELPKVRSLDFWFKPEVSKILAIIRNSIDRIEDEESRDFFRVCFSITVRKVSNTRPGEFKLYRIPPDKLKSYKPDVLKTFTIITAANIQKMRAFVNAVPNNSAYSYVIKGDTRKLLTLDPKILHKGSATVLVTSPPYGDSHTTVAYGQFSRYSSAWIGYDEKEVWQVDKIALGGKVFQESEDIGSPTLTTTLTEIEKGDEYRARETYAFFKDIDICFGQISKVMKKGQSHISYVLGNRTVKRVRVPADQILIELGEKHGFKHLVTKHREIPNKHMPSVNAPENITAMKGETMSKENIVIWEY